MVNEQDNLQVDHDTEVYAVTPVDSPSDNYLVIEHLQRIPAIFARALVYIILFFILTAFLYSILSKIDIVIMSQAIARPTSHKIKILCDREGYIEKVFIAEGQKVKANAPLFLIRSKETLTYRTKVDELNRAIPLKQEFYTNKISAALDELLQMEKDHKNFLSLKNLKLEQNKLFLQTIESDLKYWKQEDELYSEELERVEELYRKGVVSVRTRNISKVRLEKARTELDKIVPVRQINLKEYTIIKEEIEKEKANYQTKKLIFEKEINNLRLERETILNTMQHELEMNQKMLSMQDQSPVGNKVEAEKTVRVELAGIVSELHFRNVGEYVRQSDLLCTILPADSPLYMDLIVANKDIGFIETDMNIKYKFDAFPYMDHGALYGKVKAVPLSAVQNENHDMVYHVKGTLSDLHYTIDGQMYLIKAGMMATAEIVTEKKSIFAILLKKFKKPDSVPK
jgi:multidrug efflux pump subunit AcrA (membrane-fusion protein)